MGNAYLKILAKHGVGGAHPGGLPLTKVILDTIPITYNTKLLDLGCGTGETLAFIAKMYPCKIIGVDISDEMLMKASQRFSTENISIDLIRADVMQLPFSSGTFDIALSESVTLFTSINKALKEYARVLKPGGTLLAIEMTASSPLNEKEFSEVKSVYGIEQMPTLDEWESMFNQAGFAYIESHDISITPTLKFSSPKMLYDFLPHLSIIQKYNKKLGYKFYKCRV